MNGDHDDGIIDDESALTPMVKRVFASTPDARLRTLVTAFAEHAHAFVREVGLTEAEFQAAIEFVEGIGKANTDTHNEVVLAADVVGISTLVALLNNPTEGGQTAAALLGPFWRGNSPRCELGANISRHETGALPMFVSGYVRDEDGEPLSGATVDVWQASPVGLYENQDPEQPDMNLRGRFTTDAHGRYWFETVRPAGYPVPTHGPVGALLRAQGRHPYRPAHLHFMVSRPDYKTLVTQIFADDAEHLSSDVTFGVVRSCVGHFEYREGTEADARLNRPHYVFSYDLTLHPGVSEFPTPPIK
ncbi:dioxygenase family protein [Paraburkholderia oxyphila]|uniref:dioxygenase family protein n=1 Tax=Paraburkholderia oxyphila TaxID=614212 RepID=UPI000486FB58|nr:dioxygenase [Paraburkholderia oxyphila]